MDVKQAITERKSIRKYDSRPVSDEIITELIDAARLAPSGCNVQGSYYKIVKGEGINILKDKEIFPQDFVYDAPVIILCCYDKEAYPEQKNVSYGTDPVTRSIRDLSIASSFIVLRATELGLGSCYVGWMEKMKVKKILDIPKNIDVLFAITVGYPAEDPKPTVRKDIKEIMI